MARYYARFDHGYLTASGQLGTTSSGNYFERRVIGSATSSNAVLKAARLALSDAMYAQLDGANEDPTQGPIIPPSNTARTVNNITRSGGNLSWTNVYKTTTIPGVAYPADFRTRPTSSIFTDDGNVTAASPVDGGTISDTLYTDAGTALTNVIASIKKTKSGLTPIAPPYTEDGSPSTRLGTNPSRTLHSLWHDQALDYFAWDDFTPGQPQALYTKFPAANGLNEVFLETGDPLELTLEWVTEFLSDRAGDVDISFQTIRNDNQVQIDSASVTITNGNLYYTASLSANSYGNAASGYYYDVNASVKFKDATIPAHVSTLLEENVQNKVRIYRVYPISVIGPYSNANDVCTNTTTTTFYSDGALSIAPPMMLYTNKTGTLASAGLYRNPGPYTSGVTQYYSWDGGAFDPQPPGYTTYNITCP